MAKERIGLVNKEVRPQTVVVATLTDSPRLWSSLNFFQHNPQTDKRDPIPAPALNTLEAGYVFEYTAMSSGTTLVHMPYRVMDKTVGSIVSALRSFRSVGKVVNVHPIASENLKNPRSCVQDFSLGYADMDRFKNRCQANRWIVRQVKVDLANVTALVEIVQQSAGTYAAQAKDINASIMGINSEESYKAFTDKFSALETLVKRFNEAKIAAEQLIVRANLEYRPFDEQGRLSLFQDIIREASSSIDSVPIGSLFTTGTLRYKSSVHQVVEKPEWVLPLAEEIRKIGSFYPCMNLFSVKGEDTLVLQLPGISLEFSPKGFHLDGDLLALKYYTTGPSVSETTDSSARFRGLVIDD